MAWTIWRSGARSAARPLRSRSSRRLCLWMSGKKNLPGAGPRDLKPLRDDVRRDLIFDEGDTVAQLQLAFLQPLQPQQIRRRRLMQRVDRCVEIAVLLLQPGAFVFELALIFVGHGVR